MPGPPPNPNARRPNASRKSTGPATRKLPAEGSKEPTPKWPLVGKMLAGELAAWRELWATPQSVAWHQLGWTRSVARYCRAMVQAEKPGAPASLMAEARQMEDRLGLTPMSMLRLRWEIVTDEIGAARADRGTATSPPSARLRVVDTAGG